MGWGKHNGAIDHHRPPVLLLAGDPTCHGRVLASTSWQLGLITPNGIFLLVSFQTKRSPYVPDTNTVLIPIHTLSLVGSGSHMPAAPLVNRLISGASSANGIT